MTEILLLFKRITAMILTIIAFISPNLFKWITGADEDSQCILFYTDNYPEELTELLFTNNMFDDSTTVFAQKLVTTVIIQFMTGGMDNGEAAEIIAQLPIGDTERSSNEVEPLNTFTEMLAGALKDSPLMPDYIKGLLNMWSEGVNDLHVYFGYTEYEGIYEFLGSYLNDKGELKTVTTGVYYDTETHMVYGKDNNGIFGIGYDCDMDDMVLTAPSNAWMKQYGFNAGYDFLGNLIFMDCDTQRVKFNYDGRDWMVQLWKGNYTSYANGAEIGLYYLEDGEQFNYTCVDGDDMIAMKMKLYGNDNLILSASVDKHWWVCGFQPGPTVDASDMTVEADITFNSDEMAAVFAEKASATMTATADGRTVSLIWH